MNIVASDACSYCKGIYYSDCTSHDIKAILRRVITFCELSDPVCALCDKEISKIIGDEALKLEKLKVSKLFSDAHAAELKKRSDIHEKCKKMMDELERRLATTFVLTPEKKIEIEFWTKAAAKDLNDIPQLFVNSCNRILIEDQKQMLKKETIVQLEKNLSCCNLPLTEEQKTQLQHLPIIGIEEEVAMLKATYLTSQQKEALATGESLIQNWSHDKQKEQFLSTVSQGHTLSVLQTSKLRFLIFATSLTSFSDVQELFAKARNIVSAAE